MTATDARPDSITPDPAKAGENVKAGEDAKIGENAAVGSATHVDEKQARQVAEAAREADWRKPSFGKQLFLGRLRMDLVEPWPTPDPEQQADGEAFLA
ncbi:MAG TPA: acyl-CoA dehydrogenase, partial [Micromonosporaceae bacterium]|nr:acyl-CoA dehydrogenase [Micromonosporaceae bacterium]